MAGVLVFDRRKAATHTGIYGRGSAGILYKRQVNKIYWKEREILSPGRRQLHAAADNGTKEWGRSVEEISESTLVGPYGTCFSC
jgi:hypothetical protein